jgi:4-amino-4-deoxychorismate lyase
MRHRGALVSMLVNGNQSDRVPVTDRGFQYGDGLFETLAVENGEPEFFSRHLERLRIGCERLAIEFPGNEILEKEAAQICKTVESGILKIIVTRGSGSRGYRIPENARPTRVLSISPRPSFPDDLQAQGIRAVLCRTRLGINPSLAGLKHLNRLEQIIGRSEWNSPEIQEGLMLDSDGNVIEGTMSNLFLVRNGSLITPDLSRCGVAGIMRGLVLEFGRDGGIKIQVERVSVAELEDADEVFLTNSVIGIWPLAELGKIKYEIGPVSRRIMQWLAERKH